MTWVLMVLIVLADGSVDRHAISKWPTRQACALAAHNERSKVVPNDGSVYVYWCHDESQD